MTDAMEAHNPSSTWQGNCAYAYAHARRMERDRAELAEALERALSIMANHVGRESPLRAGRQLHPRHERVTRASETHPWGWGMIIGDDDSGDGETLAEAVIAALALCGAVALIVLIGLALT